MSFAANAIGFYLQAEDMLSPTLKKAAKGYAQFTKAIEGYNKKAYGSASKGLSALAAVVESFSELPAKAVASYDKARKAISAKSKHAIEMKVDLAFGTATTKGLSKTIHDAIGKAFKKTQLSFKQDPHGPGQVAAFMVKGYARGGVIGRPSGGKGFKSPSGDNQLIAAKTGEVVLPSDLVAGLRDVLSRGPMGPGYAQGGTVGPMGPMAPGDFLVNASLMQYGNLSRELDAINAAMKLGLPVEHEYARVTGMMAEEIQRLDAMTHQYGYDTLRELVPQISRVRTEFKDLQKPAERTASVFENLFGKILGPARFLMMSRVAQSVGTVLNKLYTGSSDVFHQVGGNDIEDFVTNFNQLNSKLGLSRNELGSFKSQAMSTVEGLNGAVGITQFSAAVEALTNAGMRNRPVMLEMAKVASLAAQATGDDIGELSKVTYLLSNQAGLSAEQIAAVFATQKNLVANAGVDMQTLVQTAQHGVMDMGKFFMQQTAEQRAEILKNSSRLTATLSDNWAEAGGQMAQLLQKAAGGDWEAATQAQQMFGVSVQGIRDALTSGNFAPLLETLGRQLKGMRPEDLEQMREALHFPGTAAEFAQLAENTGAMTAKLQQLQGTTVTTGQGLSALTTGADQNLTAWQKLTNQVGTFLGNLDVFGVKGVEILDFFKEFGIKNLAAVAYLARTSIELGAQAAAWLFNSAAKDKDTVSTVANTLAQEANAGAMATVGATTKVAGAGLGGMISNFGKGIGGFMEGLAGGLAAFANPKVIIGAAVVTGALIGLAYAASIAGPPLTQLFGVLLAADIGKMLALGPSLVMTGAGIAALGVGFAVGMNAALLGIPALFAVTAALKVLGGGAGGEAAGLAGFADAIAGAFVVDPVKLQAALQGMEGAVHLMSGMIALATMMSVAGLLAGGGLIGTMVVGLRNFFFGDPLQNLRTQAKDISGTVNDLAAGFSGINVPEMPKIAAKVKAVGEFMESYGKIASAVNTAAPSGGLWGAIKDFFTGSDSENLIALVGQSGRIQNVSNFLAETWANLKSSDKLPMAIKRLKPVAEMVEAYGKIATVAKMTTGGVWGAIKDFFTGSDEATMKKTIENMSSTVILLTGAMSNPAIAGLEPQIPQMEKGSKTVAKILELAAPLFASAKTLGQAAEGLTVGWFKDIFTDGYLDEIAKSIGNGGPGTLQGDVLAIGGMFGVFNAMHGPTLEQGSKNGLTVLNGAVNMYKAAAELGKQINTGGLPQIEQVQGAMQRIADLTNEAAKGVIQVQHNVNTPPLNTATLQQLVEVHVRGTVTADDSMTHELLRDLIAEVKMSRGGGQGPGAPAPTAGTPGAATNGLVTGGRPGRSVFDD